MLKRHNTKLTAINDGQYQGQTVFPKPLSSKYLESIFQTMQIALNDHPRTFMIRFDLHLPHAMSMTDSPILFDSRVISKFFKSLNAKIDNDRISKQREGKRVHPCHLRYVWVRERADADTDHYHVAIFLNNDTYNHLGNYNNNGKNLSTKILEAWASSLGLDTYSARGLVHFPQNKPVYYINKNAQDYLKIFETAFFRLSYFAKFETKHYGDRSRSFGCSRLQA